VVIIRRATEADINDIFACHREAVWTKATSHYEEKVLTAWSPGPTEARRRAATAEINDKTMVNLVAQLERDIIGFGIVIPTKNEFRALYVKSVGLQNVGKDLCYALLAEAKEMNCHHLDLDASLNAVGFYKHMGAKALHPIEHRFENGVVMPAVKMRFDLISIV
jgi:putative acetyltransferase